MDSRDSEAASQWFLSYSLVDDPTDDTLHKYPYTKERQPTPANVLATAWLIQSRGGRAIDIKQGSRLIFDEEDLGTALEIISSRGVQPGTTPVDFAEQVIQEMGKE